MENRRRESEQLQRSHQTEGIILCLFELWWWIFVGQASIFLLPRETERTTERIDLSTDDRGKRAPSLRASSTHIHTY